MDEQDILQHLLGIEADASALVNDAQAEADRRTGENERRNRSVFEEWYSRESREFEDRHTKEIGAVQADYEKQLAAFRESLDSMEIHKDDFSRLVKTLFFREP